MFGGNSVEHEISILTALSAMEHVSAERYEAIPCYVSKQGELYHGPMLKKLSAYRNLDDLCRRLKPVHVERRYGQPMLVSNGGWRRFAIPFDVVLPLFHGVNGEDGSAAGFCRMLQLPFCESDVLCSAIGQDKGVQKRLLQQAGFPIVPYAELREGETQAQWEEKLAALRYPLIIKPAMLGSSIGIEKVTDADACMAAIRRAFAYGDHVLAETCIEDLRELNCALLHTPYGYQSSAVEEVTHQGDLLDYDEKYRGSSKNAAVKKRKWLKEGELVVMVQRMTLALASLFELRGVARIDYLYDTTAKQLYVNEINTIPGSLSSYLWEWEGVDLTQLLDLIIQDGIQAYRDRGKRISSYSTNLLQEVDLTGGKKR